jgi:molybdopterin molybdotransferase
VRILGNNIEDMYSKAKTFKTLKGVDESVDLILRSLKKTDLESSEILVSDSLHYFSAEEVSSKYDTPPYNRSAVDGYAVISDDILSSSTTNPTTLKMIQEIKAETSQKEIKAVFHGEASIVYTGSQLPKNTDSVVMVEDTKVEGSSVLVYKPVSPWQNVSRKGEDFGKGAVVVGKRILIRPWHLAALLSVGKSKVKVFRRLRVGVLSTGSELKASLSSSDGGVVDTTKPLILSLIREELCDPVDLGTTPDNVNIIASKLKEALTKVDLIITTGGTSVGVTDQVEEAITRLDNTTILFHGVRMRPGRPTGLASIEGKAIFMLSGYPVAAFTGFEVFVKPAIHFIRGSRQLPSPTIKAYLSRRLTKPVGVKAFVRVSVKVDSNGKYFAQPLRLTGSGLLSSLTRGNGLLIMEEGLEGYDESENVDVMLFQPIE